jgi:hypothetical protein
MTHEKTHKNQKFSRAVRAFALQTTTTTTRFRRRRRLAPDGRRRNQPTARSLVRAPVGLVHAKERARGDGDGGARVGGRIGGGGGGAKKQRESDGGEDVDDDDDDDDGRVR